MGLIPAHAGKTDPHALSPVGGGLIPAHAGKTAWRSAIPSRPRAHPHSRGENRSAITVVTCCRGSSPLTRGKHTVAIREPSLPGLIPAHAGKTPASTLKPPSSAAHPRSRGENGAALRALDPVAGSSPLTRGKYSDFLPDGQDFGLIPAHAGKTPRRMYRRPGTAAHPRSRGENGRRPARTRTGRGSSPLTRGKRKGLTPPADVVRLIPAHAGKTLFLCPPGGEHGAHPRSRGENRERLCDGGLHGGSSPLTRGKHRDAHPRG